MNKLITIYLLTLILIIPNLGKAVIPHDHEVKSNISLNILSADDLVNLGKKEIEQKIGRKLKLKEKITFRLIKAKLKKLEYHTPNQSNKSLKTDGFAIAGLSTSLAGFLGLIVFSGLLAILFGLALGIISVTFSIIALKRIKLKPELRKGKFLAIVGLFLGSTLLLISILGGIGYLM